MTFGRRALEVPPILIYQLTQHFAAEKGVNVTINNGGYNYFQTVAARRNKFDGYKIQPILFVASRSWAEVFIFLSFF